LVYSFGFVYLIYLNFQSTRDTPRPLKILIRENEQEPDHVMKRELRSRICFATTTQPRIIPHNRSYPGLYPTTGLTQSHTVGRPC